MRIIISRNEILYSLNFLKIISPEYVKSIAVYSNIILYYVSTRDEH